MLNAGRRIVKLRSDGGPNSDFCRCHFLVARCVVHENPEFQIANLIGSEHVDDVVNNCRLERITDSSACPDYRFRHPRSSEASGSAACIVLEGAVVSARNDSPFRRFRYPAGQGVARILVAMGLPLSSAARVTTASHSSSCCAKLMMSGEAWAWVTLTMVTMSLATSVMRPLMQVSF